MAILNHRMPRMNPILRFTGLAQQALHHSQRLDFLAPLLMRLYLAPVFWMAGMNKLNSFDSTVAWFGNAEWGLGLPFPVLMAALATGAELIGAICLLLGLGVRLMAVPLMVTMLVAAFAVHWEHGWLAIAEGQGLFATDRTFAAAERLAVAKDLLRAHGNYGWLTEHGSLVMLNNGIEFAATYFIMLLSLFFTGAGRWVSLDAWIAPRLASAASDSGTPT